MLVGAKPHRKVIAPVIGFQGQLHQKLGSIEELVTSLQSASPARYENTIYQPKPAGIAFWSCRHRMKAGNYDTAASVSNGKEAVRCMILAKGN